MKPCHKSRRTVLELMSSLPRWSADQVETLVASPSFSIPELNLVLTVLAAMCAQFASGLQVAGLAGDETRPPLAERKRSFNGIKHYSWPLESFWVPVGPSWTPKLRFQCEVFPKMGYLQIIQIKTDQYWKPCFLGYPHFRKPPLYNFYSWQGFPKIGVQTLHGELQYFFLSIPNSSKFIILINQ